MFKNLYPPAISVQTDMRESLKLAKSAGFEGLDLDIDEASRLTKQHSIDYVRDLWAESDLKMGGWEFPLNWRGGDADFQEDLKGFPALAELAAALGCHRTTTQVFNWSNAPFNENWDFHIRRLKPAAEILKDYGHSLGLEFIGPAASRRIAPILVCIRHERRSGPLGNYRHRQRRTPFRHMALVHLPFHTG